MSDGGRPPNLILLITDQQRQPQHWPSDQAWLDALTPNDAELRRTGMTFTHAFTATAMCSPSRASFLTGTYPSRHGVTLTMTEGDLWPDPRNAPSTLRTAARMAMSGEIPRRRLAKSVARNALRLGPRSGSEPELPAGIETLATRLRGRGYHVVLKGKWHLSKPVDGAGWSPADPERIERDYGFAEWEPPDVGGDAKAAHFGGGNAGRVHEGWDEDYTRQMEAWLAQEDLPEPFCLVFSLVNPHDVLGYPDSYEEGGYDASEFRDLGVPLPPTLEEDLREKPAVQALSKLGMDSYLGPLGDRQAQQDYVDFYAHLHRVVDEKIGRLLKALGRPEDPGSLRSRTVIARISDHGELGLSHGGLRQKIFNAYEETIRVPLVVSNPRLFPRARESDALVSLIDIVPTFLGLAGAPAESGGLDGHDLGPVLRGETQSVRDAVLFTYDDHQAGTALQDGAGQPNRIRCVRDARWKYAVYLDPAGRAAPEYELYDLERDPLESHNLVDRVTGRASIAANEQERRRLAARLAELCERTRMLTPALPPPVTVGEGRGQHGALSEVVETLAEIDRSPCSAGERQAAEWLSERLRTIPGVEVALEDEPSWGTFPPTATGLGLLGMASAALVLRGHRASGALLAVAAYAGMVDEAQNGPRILRRLVRRRRTTVNLIARIGEQDTGRQGTGRQNSGENSGERDGVGTLVVLAHHDAPQTGLLFDQTLQRRLYELAPQVIERMKTPPPQWWIGLAGPLSTVAGAVGRRRGLARAGLAIGAIGAALVADVWRSETVQGANDNLSGVAALVALAELLRERPVPGLRVLLVSCGAEETLQDGVRGFLASHRDELAPEHTWFVNLDTVGSPHLVMLEAEGPIWMEPYTGPWLRDLLAERAEQLGITLHRGFRARASTDSVIPSRAGHPTATLVSMTDWRSPANYHLPSDIPANLDYETVADATRLVYALAEALAGDEA